MAVWAVHMTLEIISKWPDLQLLILETGNGSPASVKSAKRPGRAGPNGPCIGLVVGVVIDAVVLFGYDEIFVCASLYNDVVTNSPPLRERRRYCDGRRHAVALSAEQRLHAALVSAAKVMRCIRCSLVWFCHRWRHELTMIVHIRHKFMNEIHEITRKCAVDECTSANRRSETWRHLASCFKTL